MLERVVPESAVTQCRCSGEAKETAGDKGSTCVFGAGRQGSGKWLKDSREAE